MHKDHQVEILIINEYRKKWYHGQCRGYEIPYERVFLQFVRIEPYSENVEREENNCFKGNIAGKYHRNEIQYEIGAEFGTLTHQTIQHGLAGTVDEILLTVVKTIDDIPSCNGRGRG
jgi:hypothetical protein